MCAAEMYSTCTLRLIEGFPPVTCTSTRTGPFTLSFASVTVTLVLASIRQREGLSCLCTGRKIASFAAGGAMIMGLYTGAAGWAYTWGRSLVCSDLPCVSFYFAPGQAKSDSRTWSDPVIFFYYSSACGGHMRQATTGPEVSADLC